MATRTPTVTRAAQKGSPSGAGSATSTTPQAPRPGAGRIETPKLAHIVAARLRRRIVTGELPPGSSLPREADLIAQFGVSRPALREALRVLEAEQLISLGRGARSGATVMAPSVAQVAQHATFYLVAHGTTLRDIHEARSLIEPAIVMKLARQRPSGLVSQLRECLEAGRQSLANSDFKAAMLAANRFHEVLMHAAGNNAISLLVGMLHDVAVVNYLALDEGVTDPAATRRMLGKTLDSLSEMIELIESGTPEAAADYWRGYLARATRVLTGSGRADQAVAL